MEELSIALVHAGMSEESATARLASEIASSLAALAEEQGLNLSIRTVPVRPLAHRVVDHVLTGFPAAGLEEAQEVISSADGLVALSPTYQASYSGLFKSFFDVLDADALRGMPVLLGATGGTPRHSLVTEVAMRPLFTYAHADPVPTSLFAATEDWGAHAADSDASACEGLRSRIRRASGELLERILTKSGSAPWGASPAPVRSAAALPSEGAAPTAAAEGADRLEHPGPASQAEHWPGFTDFETLLGGGK